VGVGSGVYRKSLSINTAMDWIRTRDLTIRN
jgi:hypothetical protein